MQPTHWFVSYARNNGLKVLDDLRVQDGRQFVITDEHGADNVYVTFYFTGKYQVQGSNEALKRRVRELIDD